MGAAASGTVGSLNMFLRVMCWKEWREHWLQAGILTGLGLLILLGVYPKVMPEMGNDPPVLLSAVIFAGACGFVTGAIMLANERETHTLTFLDSLPRRRMIVWGAKVVVGVAITLVQAVVLTSAGLAVMPTVPRDIGH